MKNLAKLWRFAL